MIGVHQLKHQPLDLTELFDLPRIPFPSRAGVVADRAERSYSVARTATALYVAYRIAGDFQLHPLARPGSFIEGLWEYDLVELFLLDSGGERYEEFNIAPNGAWWRCVFSSYRVREDAVDYAEPSPGIATSQRNGSWSVAIGIPFSQLNIDFRAREGERLNVCAIVSNGHGREYLSTAPLDAVKPDFHQTVSYQRCALGVEVTE